MAELIQPCCTVSPVGTLSSFSAVLRRLPRSPPCCSEFPQVSADDRRAGAAAHRARGGDTGTCWRRHRHLGPRDALAELLLPAAGRHAHHRRPAELGRARGVSRRRVLASNLSAAAQDRAREAIASRHEVTRLFDLTRDVLLTTETGSAIDALARHVARRFELTQVAICLPADSGWRISQGGRDDVVDRDDVLNTALAKARGTLEFDAYRRAYGGHVRAGAAERTLDRAAAARHQGDRTARRVGARRSTSARSTLSPASSRSRSSACSSWPSATRRSWSGRRRSWRRRSSRRSATI